MLPTLTEIREQSNGAIVVGVSHVRPDLVSQRIYIPERAYPGPSTPCSSEYPPNRLGLSQQIGQTKRFCKDSVSTSTVTKSVDASTAFAKEIGFRKRSPRLLSGYDNHYPTSPMCFGPANLANRSNALLGCLARTSQQPDQTYVFRVGIWEPPA